MSDSALQTPRLPHEAERKVPEGLESLIAEYPALAKFVRTIEDGIRQLEALNQKYPPLQSASDTTSLEEQIS